VPYRVAQPAPSVCDLKISQDGERVACSYTFGGRAHRFDWTDDGLRRP
jgi:hypothetical protein